MCFRRSMLGAGAILALSLSILPGKAPPLEVRGEALPRVGEAPLQTRIGDWARGLHFSGRRSFGDAKLGMLLFMEQDFERGAVSREELQSAARLLKEDAITSSQIVLMRDWMAGNGGSPSLGLRILAEFRIVDTVSGASWETPLARAEGLCELHEAGIAPRQGELPGLLSEALTAVNPTDPGANAFHFVGAYRVFARSTAVVGNGEMRPLLQDLLASNLEHGDSPWVATGDPDAGAPVLAARYRQLFLGELFSNDPNAGRGIAAEVLSRLPGLLREAPLREVGAYPDMVSVVRDLVAALKADPEGAAKGVGAEWVSSLAYSLAELESEMFRRVQDGDFAGEGERRLLEWKATQTKEILDAIEGLQGGGSR